jgi:FkbM family methyltransferase
MTIQELKARFARGELPRDEFWLAAQKEYRLLREQSPLPDNGAITAIHDVSGDLVVELPNGLRMLWDPNDLRTAPNMLLNHGAYEEGERAVLMAIAKHCEIVFDIGANVGWYALNIGRALPANAHVYAFEPIPRTFAVLARNVALNDLNNVTPLPFGLGEASDDVDFFIPGVTGSVAASQRKLFESQSNERVRATITRLDDVTRQLGINRLDLIKCDIEGGELSMLRGGMETIRRFKPAIFLELLRKWSRVYDYQPDDVIALLKGEGYACYAIGDSGLERLLAIDEDCTSTNFLFLQA